MTNDVGRRLRSALVAGAVAALIVAASLPLSVRIADAYPTTSGNFNSLGCGFAGDTGAYSWVGYANTSRHISGCGTYAAVYLDYKTGGTWYGPYWSYQYNTNYGWAATYAVYANVTDTYSGHQIYTSGAWRQVENLINFDW